MIKTGVGLLAVWYQPTPAGEAELNRWYEEEHLQERMEIPGFLAARRYRNLREGAKYIALYDMENLSVLAGDAYMKVRKNPTPLTRRVNADATINVRNEYELVRTIGPNPIEPAPYLFMVQLETDPEHDAELNQWYDNEHLAALAGVPGCRGARRYRSSHAVPKYLAVYEIASPDLPDSAVWRKAADTPWTLKLRPHFINRVYTMGELFRAIS
ncbi:MAG TPA: hypothetical protein VJB57_03055 [Dehalococcoidia bacterium]|nr:hypothetical protein [Dehalococcoidia bacterium]